MIRARASALRPEVLPAELRQRDQWVVWRLQQGRSRATKVPYDARAARKASTADAATWVSFDHALRAFQDGDFDGVGFVFTAEDPYCGVDLDHCRDPETDELEPWARSIVQQLDSYTEISPSGTGLHIIARGKLPSGGRRKGATEMYDSGRFFCTTGAHMDGTPTTVESRQDELAQLHVDVFSPSEPERPDPREDRTGSDEALLDRARRARNGAKLIQLFDQGDWQGAGYPSQSEADLALCSMLAFWCDGDTSRVDQLFRRSALVRGKWDDKHYGDGRTYGQGVLARAADAGRRASGRPVGRAGGSTGRGPDDGPSDKAHLVRVLGRKASATARERGWRLDLTDLGNAERLILRYGADIRWSRAHGWLIWDGKRWKADSTRRVQRRAVKTIRQLHLEALHCGDSDTEKAITKWAHQSQKAERVASMLTLATSLEDVPIEPEALDCPPTPADTYLLNVANGTLQLRGGAEPSVHLDEHRRENLLTKLCPVAYDADVDDSRWRAAVETWTGGDTELATFLQTATGYSLLGAAHEKMLLFIYGPKDGSKSTFLEAVKATLGDYASTADLETFLQGRRADGSAPREDLARLAGVRFVTSIEVSRGRKLAEGLVKQLTGGDTVTARYMYKGLFEYRPQFVLWLAANDAPEARADDDALWRRIRRIPFDRSIPIDQQDETLGAFLRDPERGGRQVLRWAVEGALRYLREGLRSPDAVVASTESYRQEVDPMAEFIEDRCVFVGQAQTATSALRREYVEWCERNGYRPQGPNQLAAALRRRDYSPVRIGRQCERGWRGIALRELHHADTADAPDTDLRNSPSRGVHERKLRKPPSELSAVSADRPQAPCSDCRGREFWRYHPPGSSPWGCVTCTPRAPGRAFQVWQLRDGGC